MKEPAIELRWMGQRIILKASGDTETARAAVRLAARKLREAERPGKSAAAPHHTALLALLELAREHTELRSRMREILGEVIETTREIRALESEPETSPPCQPS